MTFVISLTLKSVCFYYFSDLKMKSYIVRMANRKGVKLDLDQLEPRAKCTPSPHSKENCTIIIPEVAIIL